MDFVSLFAGIGGFDAGFEAAGLKCIGQVEIDDACQRVLSRHWPNVPKHKDVREIDGEQFKSVDVICGGFPCQDLSVAGRRKGLAGERSGLWFEFHRIIKDAQPRFVVIENVPGLLSSDEGRDFAVIVQGLVKCGYRVAYRILDAQYFGVAQRRRRVFIVGSLGDGSCAQILFESEGLCGNPKTSRKARAGDTRNIAASLTANYGKQLDNSDRNGGPPNLIDVAHAVRTSGNRTMWDGADNIVPTMRSNGDAHSGFGWSDSSDLSPTLESEGGSHQGGPERVPFVSVDLQNTRLGNEQAGTLDTTRPSRGGGQAVIGFHCTQDPISGEIAPAMSSGNREGCATIGVSNAMGVRRLTPVECERLQGFTDNWTASESDSTRYRMLGNAVCRNVAEWLGKRILEAM